MKLIILILLFILSGVGAAISQNAFSDAISLSQNGQSFIEIIEKIQAVGKMNERQKKDFESLKLFLKDPWNTEIKKINFKIMLEIPSIVAGFEDSVRSFNKNIEALENDIKEIQDKKVEIETLKRKVTTNIPETPEDTLKNQLEDSLKTLINKLNSLDTIITYKNSQIKLYDSLKNNAADVKAIQGNFKEIKQEMKNGNDPISLLGENNEQEVKQTVSNANFSLSQAAIIDAIGNAIIEQVKEGLVNALFEGILDKDFQLGNLSLASIVPVDIKNYSIIDTIGFKDGDIITKAEYYDGFNIVESTFDPSYFDGIGYVVKHSERIDTFKIYKAKLKNELRLFFPKTIKVLEQLKESKTNNYFTNLNITLKNSFSDDLKNMLDNITDENNVNRSQVFRDFFFERNGKKKQEYEYLILAVNLINNIKKGFHPVELIPVFEDFLSNQGDFKEYADYISMIDLLQKNLRDVADNSKSIWINITSLAELNSTPVPGSKSVAEYFTAILYQTDKEKFRFLRDYFKPDSTFNERFNDFKTDLSSFIVNIRSVEKNIDELTKGDSKSFNDYAQYLDNFLVLLDSTNSLLSKYFFVIKTDSTIKVNIDKFRKYTGYSMSIYKSITNSSYSKILPVILEMFNDQINLARDSKDFKNEIVKYTNLYVDISTATSQAELNSAISKAAHNSGGFLRKSEEDFNISIDSYPGIFVSSENLNNANGGLNGGFSVPLGLNIQYWKFSLFLQAFDIVAAVNYRFNNDDSTTNLPSDVTFQQVFSPGAFIVFNPLEKFPISLSVGLSVTPALREVSGSGITLNESKSTFYGFSISYNVPLWYLY